MPNKINLTRTNSIQKLNTNIIKSSTKKLISPQNTTAPNLSQPISSADIKQIKMKKIKSQKTKILDTKPQIKPVKLHKCPLGKPISRLLTLFLPMTWVGIPFEIRPNEAIVISYWGKPKEVINNEGFYFRSVVGRDVKRIPTSVQSYNMPNIRVADKRGTPLTLSAIVNYQITDPLKAAFAVDDGNWRKFFQNQAQSALRTFTAKFPYSSGEDEPVLKSTTKEMKVKLIKALQKLVNVAGIKIIGFNIDEIQCDKDFMALQQAQVMADAKEILSKRLAEIANSTVNALHLAESEKPQKAYELVQELIAISNDKGNTLPLYHINKS